MKKYLLLCLSCLCLLNVAAIFEIYNWVEPEQFKQWLEAKKPMILVDIQDKPSFAAHHFPGSIETNAFPTETDAERKRIDPAVAAFKKSGQEVVVLCPRGGGGAKRTYDYLKAQGVPEKKLFILTGGVDKWPYRTMLEATK
jgi:rhodanese-related sulfurtransferase